MRPTTAPLTMVAAVAANAHWKKKFRKPFPSSAVRKKFDVPMKKFALWPAAPGGNFGRSSSVLGSPYANAYPHPKKQVALMHASCA